MDSADASFEGIATEALAVAQHNQLTILHLSRAVQALAIVARREQLLSSEETAMLAGSISGLAEAYDGSAAPGVAAFSKQLQSLAALLKLGPPQDSPSPQRH